MARRGLLWVCLTGYVLCLQLNFDIRGSRINKTNVHGYNSGRGRMIWLDSLPWVTVFMVSRCVRVCLKTFKKNNCLQFCAVSHTQQTGEAALTRRSHATTTTIPVLAAAGQRFHAVLCVLPSLMSVGGGGESWGHVFLEVHGFTDTVCNIAATTAIKALPERPDLVGCFRGTVKSSVRHIVRSETRWKVVSYDICCAHSGHGAAPSRLWSKPKWLHEAFHGEVCAPLKNKQRYCCLIRHIDSVASLWLRSNSINWLSGDWTSPFVSCISCCYAKWQLRRRRLLVAQNFSSKRPFCTNLQVYFLQIVFCLNFRETGLFCGAGLTLGLLASWLNQN